MPYKEFEFVFMGDTQHAQFDRVVTEQQVQYHITFDDPGFRTSFGNPIVWFEAGRPRWSLPNHDLSSELMMSVWQGLKTYVNKEDRFE